MKHIKIGILIPTYRRSKELETCIESIKTNTNNNYSIVVINDGSDAGVSNLLQYKHPDVIEIKSTSDLWWTQSINTGIHYLVENEFNATIILNDDVTVGSEFIDSIIECNKENPESIIVSKIVDQKGDLWAMGGFTSWPFVGERHINSKNQNKKITWSPGMGTFIPIDIIKKIGYLDDKSMPQYLSDADFGLRAIRAGIEIIANESGVVHNNTFTTGGILNKTQLGFMDLKFLLFDFRSPDYLKARSVFIFRHAPFGLRSISLTFRLLKIFIFLIRRF